MIDDYRKASKRGQREVSAAISQGRYPYLPALDDILGESGSAGELPVGLCEIPMELVVGTKTRSRSNMFSCGFLPIAEAGTEFAAKWSALYDAQKEEGIRDPVVVYEYLQRFYVQEGNKRVSVLRSLDAPTITASITRVMPKPSDEHEIRCYHEFVRLYRVAPVYGLVFSKEGSYERLAVLLGQNLKDPWPDDVVRSLDATLYQFGRSYRARGGEMLSQTVADAFLIYVKSYATSKLLNVSQREMDRRVAQLWGEFVVASQKDAIAYIEAPYEAKGGIIPSVKGAARGMLRVGPLRMAFIYDRYPDVSGSTALHEQGRIDLQNKLGGAIDTTAYFGRASDADFDQAFAAAIADEAEVVVTSSPRQMEQARRAAIAHPEIIVINCSINLSSRAVRTFYARMYEVKFLMGVLAAGIAENHRVGYLATSPIFGSVAEVNAFAIGAAMVDPYCSVHLKWSSAKDNDWRRELLDDDVHVLAGRDYPNPLDPNEPYGLTCLHHSGEPESVALPVWNWGRYYELLVRSIQDARWRKEGSVHRDRALNYWWGMSADVVRLDLREGIAAGQRRLVKTLRREVVEGRLHPFEGLLVAQGGQVVHEEDMPRLAGEEIAAMRWLNENVVGRLPKTWELSQAVAGDVATSGASSLQRPTQITEAVVVRILAVADVENDELITRLEQRDADRRYDLVISCGDLSMSYLDCVATLANAPLFYVRGNHDIGYDNDPHLGGTNLDGRVERFCGLRISGLEGSLDYREGIVGYSQSEMRHRVVALGLRAALTGGIDVLVTHTPPRGHGDLPDIPHQGFDAFNGLLDWLHPKLMLHGHVHLNYGLIERERRHPSGTRLVNAFGWQDIVL